MPIFRHVNRRYETAMANWVTVNFLTAYTVGMSVIIYTDCSIAQYSITIIFCYHGIKHQQFPFFQKEVTNARSESKSIFFSVSIKELIWQSFVICNYFIHYKCYYISPSGFYCATTYWWNFILTKYNVAKKNCDPIWCTDKKAKLWLKFWF